MKRAKISTYISAFAIVTVIIFLIYAMVQKTYCTIANDPQLQKTEQEGDTGFLPYPPLFPTIINTYKN